MRSKGVSRYEYMNSWKKFEETSLPSKDAFYSKLNMEGIIDEGHEHTKQVWYIMEEKTLDCYHDTHQRTDALLLADVFETFRDTCLRHYKLDPVQFYTAPGLAWQALLKTANEYCEHEKRCKDCNVCSNEFRLDIFADIDMLLMFEKGIRGGITQAFKRCAKANNKYMKDLYNPNEESTYLQYLDANNLYGWRILQKLPAHGFLRIKKVEEFNPEKIDELIKKDREGYSLEVDVEYPKEFLENHNEIPF